MEILSFSANQGNLEILVPNEKNGSPNYTLED